MTHYAGLDVSMNKTFICILNEKGKIVRELQAASIKGLDFLRISSLT